MYTKGNYQYAEAGKVLVSSRMIGYQIPVGVECYEEPILLDDMQLQDGMLMYSNRRIVQQYCPTMSYDEWKTRIIKWRYSNDDQIAIILNRDESLEHELDYQRMQEWREWASTLAKKIIDIRDEG